MAYKDHGMTPEKLYPTMSEEPKKIYPHMMSIPSSAFDEGEYEPGHVCTLKIQVEIESMGKQYYECRLMKSQEVEEEKE